MAELTISADEIKGAIEQYVSSFEAEASRDEVGTITDTADGIAHVSGLPGAMANELLQFPGGVQGVALNLDEDEIGAVILGDYLVYICGSTDLLVGGLRPRQLRARAAAGEFGHRDQCFGSVESVGPLGQCA